MVTTPPYTAYLKIAEGCSNGCSFCIIPKLRGRYRSRDMDSLLAEVMADMNLEEALAPEILAAAWKKAAGNAMVALSELVSVAGGTACIRVGHPAVRYELTRLKPRIIEALNSELGAGSVRFVRFVTR